MIPGNMNAVGRVRTISAFHGIASQARREPRPPTLLALDYFGLTGDGNWIGAVLVWQDGRRRGELV
jgi:hypothetical protein